MLVAAFAAAAGRRQTAALAQARSALSDSDSMSSGAGSLRWAWPLAARCAYELHDTAVSLELLTILDPHKPGELPPMLRAERDLVRARLAARNGGADARALFAAAVGALRTMSTPHHLAHGLLDQSEFLLACGDSVAGHGAVADAREIAERLGCPPLPDRADRITAGTTAVR